MLTIVEDPMTLQETQSIISAEMLAMCAVQSIPLAGNAAGNTEDYLDLTGENTVAPLDHG